ncbi:MAG: Nramp family divalent metal transporter [Phycisphaerales bacterium]|nr:Nramp family divalent metal transporter [Phycisphaerales bacterium]
MPKRSSSWFAAIAPGILIAATGVGAGDLITAGVAGSTLGLTIAWAALAGGVLKWFLNEGIARWQMATNTTLLEGWVLHLGRWIQWIFLSYLLIWTFVTAGAIVNACGVAGNGLWPLHPDASTSKIIWGLIHSAAGFVLVWVGGFKLFGKMMSVFIAVMFVAVVLTAILIKPDWAAVGRGVLTPSFPKEGLGWVFGVLGGVGGTVTLLCYGYWIREEGRAGAEGVRACRLDLALGYGMTVLFGIAMIIIGSQVTITGSGAKVAPLLAAQLEKTMGTAGKWVFLVGFWGAVFSSLLGVWQSVPYLFADFLTLRRCRSLEQRQAIDYTKTRAYRIYLVAIATIPTILLWYEVLQIQKAYAVLGACFMPLLALTLLVLNNRRDLVTPRFCNGWLTNMMLAATLLFFLYHGATKSIRTLAPADKSESGASGGLKVFESQALETSATRCDNAPFSPLTVRTGR